VGAHFLSYVHLAARNESAILFASKINHMDTLQTTEPFTIK